MSAPATSRREWLERRRQGTGASDVAAIMGRSPTGSPWSVWVDKLGLVPLDDDDPSPEMAFGRDLEPVIAMWFHRRTGLYVHGEQTMVYRPGDATQFATVDGFVLEPGSDDIDLALGVFEAKYTADPPWAVVPEHYVIQTQWALWCSGLPRAWVATMHLPFGRPRFEVYELERDEALIAEVVAGVEAFWDEHVLTGIPPEPDDHPATDRAIAAAAAWINPVTTPVVDLEPYRDVVEEWRRLKELKARAEAELKAAERILRPLLLEVSEGCLDGQLAVSYRAQGRCTVDVDAVRADHGDRYDRRSTVRVLRTHTPKAPRRTA